MEKIFTATARVTGGRNGHVVSEDGVLDMELRSPKELGGEGGRYTNPEQLFAAGYAACFNSAMMLAARRKRLDADNAQVEVAVTLGRDDSDGGYRLEASIKVTFHGISREDAELLLDEAHKLCPYSKAIRGNVEVKLGYTVD